jgi:hypothetical protein
MTGPSNAAQFEQALEALHLGPMPEDEQQWMRRVGDAIYGKPPLIQGGGHKARK